MKSPANLRVFNFLFFALLAMFISFLPVYLDAQGLAATEIGFIIGTGGFVSLFASPFWGMVSDRAKTIRKVLLLLIACSTIVGYVLYASGSFALLITFTMLMYFFLLSMDPLTESLNFQTAEARGVSYGSIRTFGALGYAVMSLAVGYVMKLFGVEGMAPLYAVIGVISFLVVLTLDDAPAASKPVKLKALGKFLTHRETLMFLILIFMAAVPSRANDTYLGVYLRELGGGPELIGQAWFLAAGSEILVFALSFWWMRQGKEMALIAFASLCYFLRFFLSAWITDPHALTYLQVLQIFTFPIFYTAAIQYLYRIVPEEWRATGQTVLALLFFGVSGIVASYAGGWLFEAFSGHVYYLAISAVSCCAFLFSLVLLAFSGKKDRTGRQEIRAT
ncbi:MFS transporter [Paenibacillus montanisoli]|uniref:MFS transporter n=1 Tax=Paenibacillus montanisoli TaxID=2081970 RepID=A0A328U7J4_9BACL|nr:MFS transporter [Paenibacillus montanisoli]RAP77361.1 MFS transporter [Paenibacillus montanisoli]